MEPSKLAVGYIRVSTEDQATDGISLDAQRKRIEAWCVAKGCQLLSMRDDAGLSGKRADNRPGLQAALDECKAKGAALVVVKLDRLSRNVDDIRSILKMLTKKAGGLMCIDETFDTKTAFGRLVFGIRALLSEFERELISERTKAAMDHKKRNGQYCGSVPYGWDRDGDSLRPNMQEQAMLGSIITMRKAGSSLRAIADQLNHCGVLSKCGKAWSAAAVDSVCSREAAV